MKKTLLFFSSFFFLFNAGAQQDSLQSEPVSSVPKKTERIHEINIGFSNLLTNRNSFWEEILLLDVYDFYSGGYFLFEGIAINSSRIGLGYKFHLPKCAFRIYSDYGISNNSFEDKDESISNSNPYERTESYSWNSTFFTGRYGMEFLSVYKKTDIFYGADGIIQVGTWKYEYEAETYYNYPYYPYAVRTKNKSKATYQAYGGGAVLGLRYHITDLVSVSMETRLDMTIYNQKGSGESSSFPAGQYSSPQSSSDDFSSKGIRTKISPLGFLSLNVHL